MLSEYCNYDCCHSVLRRGFIFYLQQIANSIFSSKLWDILNPLVTAANPEIAASSPKRFDCEVWNFPTTIIGFMGAGVFVQNGIINLVKDNKSTLIFIKVILWKLSDVENARRDIYLAFVGVIIVYLVFGYTYTITFRGKVDSIPDLIYDVKLHLCWIIIFFKALPQDDKILIAAYFIGLIRMITGDACERLRLNIFKLLPFWPISFVRKYSTFFSEMNGQASFMSSSSTLLFSCLVFFFQFTPRTSGGFCLMEVDSEQWFTFIFCLLALKSVSSFSDTL